LLDSLLQETQQLELPSAAYFIIPGSDGGSGLVKLESSQEWIAVIC